MNMQAQQKELRQEVSQFRTPSRARSNWQLSNTLIPYIGSWVAAYFASQVSLWLALPFIALASLFMVRVFVLFHDCGHHSFFRSQKWNDFWGVIMGVLTFTPYYYWHANHARHHATSSNLDKRGHGDVWMMTVDEYESASPRERMQYRLYRNPVIMFLLGPLFIALISHRLIRRDASLKERINVYITNATIVALGVTLALVMGWSTYLFIQIGVLYFGLMFGIWLFYVQHQFEDVYWARHSSWDYVTASLEGGSFYDLPAVLRWFTGSIGYHHIHHLNPRIPNYRLAECHEGVKALNATPRVGIRHSLKALRYRLLDEESGKMVSFREARELVASRAA